MDIPTFSTTMGLLSFLSRFFPCLAAPPEVAPSPEALTRAEAEIQAFLARQAASSTEETGETHYSFRRKTPDEPPPEASNIRFSLAPDFDHELREKAGEAPEAGTPLARHRPPGSPLGVSFSAELQRLVRERFAGRSSWVYKAAHLSRQTYSAIISDENRTIARGTALALVFALHLTLEEAEALLHKAGYSLSESILSDVICRCCLRHGVTSLDALNRLLAKYHCAPLP